MDTKETIESLLEEKYQKSLDQFCEDITEPERDTYQSKLESFESHKARQKEQLKRRMEDLRDEYVIAYEVIFEHLIGNKSTQIVLTRTEKETLLSEIHKGQQNLLKVMETEQLCEQLNAGKSFQDILGYSVNTLEKFYFVGLECIEKKEFAKGKDVFSLLTLINPGYHNFWVSSILCYQSLGKWEEALYACKRAKETDHTDPMPHLYASECYAELKDHSQALQEVELVIEFSDEQNDTDLQEIKRLALVWKEQLIKIA